MLKKTLLVTSALASAALMSTASLAELKVSGTQEWEYSSANTLNTSTNNKLIGSETVIKFSGSGSFGIECLSRGSAKVYFIEKNINALRILEKNINSINSKEKCKIINKDILNIEIINLSSNKIDLIFLDPPFNYEHWNELLKKINLIKKNSPDCTIIIHQEINKNIIYDKYLDIFLQKKYGISLINFAKFKF